jgi:heat shock protein HslJ
MRTLFLCLLVLAVACRRPSSQLRATLTPTDSAKLLTSTKLASYNELPDYSRHLMAGNQLIAMGYEPDWSLIVNPSHNQLRFRFSATDSVVSQVPERLVDPDGSFRYNAKIGDDQLRVLFALDSCIDKRSGKRLDYRVEISFRSKTYSGCGISLQKLALLQDNWVLTMLGDKPIKATETRNEVPRLEISLTEGRVTGTTGCNRLSGPVRADTRRIRFGALVTTRMACLGEGSQLESAFVKALDAPLTYQVGDSKLIFFRNDEPVMTFKKVD